jgi:hypothetical protein
MKQTAVEWLREKLQLEFGFIFSDNILNQAKKMEKEQIFKALIRGHNDCGVFTMQSECDEYYNETFNNSIKNKW